MAVYVDNFNAPFGRMTMCHMIADTTEELLQMVDTIGVQRKWIQDPGTTYEHFDICLSKKQKAIAAGAIEITPRQLVNIKNPSVCTCKEDQKQRAVCPVCDPVEYKASLNLSQRKTLL